MSDQDLMHTELEGDQEEFRADETFSEGIPDQSAADAAPLQASLVVQKENETLQEYRIEKLPVEIGRKSENDIVLEEKNVSRKHARISLREDQYILEDLGSMGGTLLNGEKISEGEMHTGDIIKIGSYTLRFDSGRPEDERTVYDADEATALEEETAMDEDRTMFYEEPEAKLVVVKSDSLEGEITLEEGLLIFGRDDDADITIDDKRVSRRHCSIAVEGDGFVISDLGSSNGTYVNGTKVDKKTLENGDRIHIGSSILEFHVEKTLRPKPKSRVSTFVKGVAALGALAVLAFVAVKLIPSLSMKGPERVIMQERWEYRTQAAVIASPSLGDLNGDGFLNLVVTDVNGNVYALDGREGGLMWNTVFKSGGGALSSSAVLGDINQQDGMLDVVLATKNRGVVTIDGGRMNQIWMKNPRSGIASTPAAADINDDGIFDVVVGTETGQVICYDGREGGTYWEFNADSPILASPILGDLNGDLVPDVIVGSKNGRIYVLNGKNGDQIYTYVGTEEPSTAALGRFDDDRTPDIVIAFASRVVVLDGKKGSLIWSWTVPESAHPKNADPFIPAAPAVADLNADRRQDVVVSTPGGHVYAIDGASRGANYLWDFSISSARKTAPALFDFNRDRTPDVVFGDTDGNLIIADGTNGQRLNSLVIGGAIRSTPVIGDFTHDGRMNIAVGTQSMKVVAIETETRGKKGIIIRNAF